MPFDRRFGVPDRLEPPNRVAIDGKGSAGSVQREGRIITVGVSPAWDVSCRGRDLDWGRHAQIDEQVARPAGKSLNVSRALAWMGVPNVATGLWGREDYEQMQAATARLGGLVQAQMTPADGRTRLNITVVDTLHHREMHLRRRSELATGYSLDRLGADLNRLVREGDTCIFAGAMPEGPLAEAAVDLVRTGRERQAWIAVDTYGPALSRIVDEGLASLIAPNVSELRELLARDVEDEPAGLVQAGRTLLEKAEMVLISRGEKGAILIASDGAWSGRPQRQRPALSTVGCGDYLLAGFLAQLRETGELPSALATGLKIAGARAWGWTDTKNWQEVEQEVAVTIESV